MTVRVTTGGPAGPTRVSVHSSYGQLRGRRVRTAATSSDGRWRWTLCVDGHGNPGGWLMRYLPTGHHWTVEDLDAGRMAAALHGAALAVIAEQDGQAMAGPCQGAGCGGGGQAVGVVDTEAGPQPVCPACVAHAVLAGRPVRRPGVDPLPGTITLGDPPPAPARVTLYAAGDRVYIYPDAEADPAVAAQIASVRAVFAVALPAGDDLLRTIDVRHLGPVLAHLRGCGLRVEDLREGGHGG